jgi:hypothetical protein
VKEVLQWGAVVIVVGILLAFAFCNVFWYSGRK